MPLTIAELQTELSADSSQFDAKLEAANRKLLAFGETEYPDAQLRVNIDTAKVALDALRKDWDELKRDMESGAPVGVGTGAGVGTHSGANLRPSTAKPERVAATTAATVEQIEKVSNARRESEARRTETVVEGIEARGAAKRGQTELSERQKTDAAVGRAAQVAQERRQQRLGQIEDEFLKRQDLKARARASAPAPTLRQHARNLSNDGQNDVQSGMILSGMFTAPLVAGGALAIKTGIDWETAFTGVTKTVDGTDAQLKELSNTLRNMAAGKKAIPIDANELAGIAEAAGQLGIQTPRIAAFTRVMADLGQTTDMSSAQAADQLARFANIIQMPQTQFDRLGSTIVDLGNKTAATESEIVNMGERLAGSGHQIGLSAPQIMGFAAALSSVGVEAEMGGTAFQKFFVSVEQSVREGGKQLELYAKVAGVSSSAFKKAFHNDAATALVSVIEGLGRMQKAGGNTFGTLAKLGLGGERVRDALLRAAGAGDLFSTSLQTGQRAWRQNTALAAEAEKRYATTASQIKILSNRVKEQALEISDKLLPVVNKLIRSYGDDLPRAIGASVSVFDSLPQSAQKGVIASAAILAMVGPAQIATGNVKILKGAFISMWAAAAANPVTAVAAVLALVAGYVILNKTFSVIAQAQEDAKRNADEMTGSFKRMLDVLPSGSKSAVEIQKIRNEVAAAGTDVDKLNKAAQDLAKTRAQLNVEIKNPDLALVMNSELDRAQKALDRQKLTATVIVRPFIEQAQRAVTDTIGLTNDKRPVWDNTFDDGGGDNGYVNNFIDWATGNSGKRDDVPDPRFVAGGGMIDSGIFENKTEETRALERGHAQAMKAKANASAARNGQAFDAFQKHQSLVTGQKPLLDGVNLSLDPFAGQSLATSKAADGSPLYTAPGATPVDLSPAGVEAARKRLLAQKAKKEAENKPAPHPAAHPSTFAGVSSGASDKEAEKERKKQEAQQRREEAAQRKREALLSAWRAKQATALDEGARPWEHLNETIGQMGLRLGEFDAATDGARAKAKLLSKEFSGLPKPIQDATVQMATLLDQMDEMAKQRDGLREGNAQTLSSLLKSGAGLQPFLKAVRGEEGAYNFGGRIDAARGRANTIGSLLGPLAAGEVSKRKKQAEALREQNDEQKFAPLGGEAGAPHGEITTQMVRDSARVAQVPKAISACAYVASQMLDSFGVAIPGMVRASKTGVKTYEANVATLEALVQRAGAHKIPLSAARPGDTLIWDTAMSRKYGDGRKYGAGSGKHVEIYEGGDKSDGNRGGVKRGNPRDIAASLYDKNAITVYQTSALVRSASPVAPDASHSGGAFKLSAREQAHGEQVYRSIAPEHLRLWKERDFYNPKWTDAQAQKHDAASNVALEGYERQHGISDARHQDIRAAILEHATQGEAPASAPAKVAPKVAAPKAPAPKAATSGSFLPAPQLALIDALLKAQAAHKVFDDSPAAKAQLHTENAAWGKAMAYYKAHGLKTTEVGSDAMLRVWEKRGRLEDKYKNKYSSKSAGTTSSAGATSSAPSTSEKMPSVAASPLESPTRAKPKTGALLPYSETELSAFLKAWGPIVTEGHEKPGESKSFRLSKQDELLGRLAAGERLSPKRVTADRVASNAADTSSAHAKATQDAKDAAKEFSRAQSDQTRVLTESKAAFDASGGSMAAYERQAHLTQKRIEIYSSAHIMALWNQKRFAEANKDARKQLAGEAAIYDAGKGNDHAMGASRAATALSDETASLNEQRDYLLQNAGKPEAVIARGLDEISRKWAEYRRLVDEEGADPVAAKAQAAKTAALQAGNAATREAVDLQRQLNAERLTRQNDLDTLSADEGRMDSGLNAGQRTRQKAGDDAGRAKSRQLDSAVDDGTMSIEEANALVRQAHDDALENFDRQARLKRAGDDESQSQNHDARMTLLSGQTDLTKKYAPGNSELEIQMRLLERENELKLQNSQLDDSEQINVKARLDDYEAELRAEDKLSDLTRQRAAVQSAVENTLSLQKEHELAMAHTAAGRLAIEQKYDEILRGRRGEEVSPEEKAEQVKQRALATQNAQLENAKAVAGQMRDLIASSMDEGAKTGVTAMLGHWFAGLAEMMQKAAVNRVANGITKGIFGVDLLGQEGDVFDVLNGKNGRQKTGADGAKAGADTSPAGAGKGPSLAVIPSILDSLHKHRQKAKVADGVDTAPEAVKRGGLGGIVDAIAGGGQGGQGGTSQINHATIHIQTATEHINHAVINTHGAGGKHAGGGSGSAPSYEQVLGAFGAGV